jgi:PAS domain S-box-containing protein
VETALQENEQRLKLALETAALGFYERDLISNRVTVDSNWRVIMGLPEGEPRPDFAPNSLFAEDRHRVLGLITRAFDSRLQEVVAADFRIVRPNGQVRWVGGRGRVIFDNSVQPAKALKFMGVLQDITERKNDELALAEVRAHLSRANEDLEKQVRERTVKLVQANAELEAFCYSLSHDMRSPLRAIVSFTELAIEDSTPQLTVVSRKFLQQVITAARRLDRLIQDVLAFSRISSMKVELRSVDPQELLRQILNERPEFQAPAADVQIEGQIPRVLGHEASLTQCFTNLLSNAVKFALPGVTPRVRISGEKVGDKVRIWIEDNGIGIESSAHAMIFELFERGRKAKAYEGVGAGLAIVSRAVERMRGRVGVESEAGRGSRFWLELSATKATP